MANLELDDVRKVFQDGDDEIVAVDDVSIDIRDGEFLVLVGPSGCGKSTTLRTVAGLETITDGEIRLDGARINERSPQERDIAMVFQSYALYPHMTVRENMRFGLEESTEMADDEMDETVEDVAELLTIDDLLERYPSELSGGQQQRVALGRAIVRDPLAFLMDEPLSNLDAKLRAEMRTELKRLQSELETTTIYVTHDQTEAMTMGDRIAILDGGELQQVDPPLTCYHRPNNLFVAGFLGEPSMNFCRVEYGNGRLDGDGFEYPLPDAIVDGLDVEPGRALTLGVRPEDLTLVESAADDHAYPASVGVVEPKGNENIVNLEFADGVALTATTDGVTPISRNTETVVSIPPEAIHLFDDRTGEAVHNREFDDEDVELLH
jgi:multiple sugar transport system ATP-binding protein